MNFTTEHHLGHLAEAEATSEARRSTTDDPGPPCGAIPAPNAVLLRPGHLWGGLRLPFRYISIARIRLASIRRPHRACLRSRHDMHVLHGEELCADDRDRAERRIDLRLCAPRSRSL